MDASLKALIDRLRIKPWLNDQGDVTKLIVLDRGSDARELIARLGDFPELTEFWATNTIVGDAGVRALRAAQLEVAFLGKSGLTDASIPVLVHLDRLRKLSIEWNRITDAGIRQLSECRNLTFLNCERTAATTTGLAALASLAHLESLLASGTGPGEAIDFSGFPALKHFRLYDSAIDESHLQRLDAARSIEVLQVGNTQVSDAIIEALTKMPRLLEVDLSRTRVTREGIKRLRASRPKLAVRHS